MDTERVIVFFESPDGRNLWKAVAREDLPDWIRDQAVIDRLLAGEQARNANEKTERYFKAVAVDPPRPAGQHEARRQAMQGASGMTPGGIALPH